MITPIRRITPRKSLEVIYNILPLDLQGQLEAISTQNRNARILRLKWTGHYPNKKTYIGHRYHWNKVTLIRWSGAHCNHSYCEDNKGG